MLWWGWGWDDGDDGINRRYEKICIETEAKMEKDLTQSSPFFRKYRGGQLRAHSRCQRDSR